jgi:hypothetical protein
MIERIAIGEPMRTAAPREITLAEARRLALLFLSKAEAERKWTAQKEAERTACGYSDLQVTP